MFQILRKKMLKKCLPIVPDELTLLSMNDAESNAIYEKYHRVIRKYGYRKKYKNTNHYPQSQSQM